MLNQGLIGIVIVIVIVFLYYKVYLKGSSESMDKYEYHKRKRDNWYKLNKTIKTKPYDTHSPSCPECGNQDCNCDSRQNGAKNLIQSQKDKVQGKRTGGVGLYNKIKRGNGAPERQMAAHIISSSVTPGATDNDPGDFASYMTKVSINPDIIDSHQNFVSESKMFSQQPAIPSDVIESNYGNWWGLGRRSFKAPNPDALMQFGANDEDYNTNWNMSFG
jgi:hypothetical protein